MNCKRGSGWGNALSVSVVIPVYRNQETLPELIRRLTRVLEGVASQWQIVCVHDASPDGSLEVLVDFARHDPRIVVVDLPRNVGQSRAVWLGLRVATGDAVVVMDADLQDPPEAIPRLVKTLNDRARRWEAVFAGHRGKYEPWLRWITGRLFRAFRGWLCGIPRDAGSFGVMSRAAVRAILQLEVPLPHWPVLVGLAGLRSRSIPVRRRRRPHGNSAYSLGKRLALAWTMTQSMLQPRCRGTTPRSVSPPILLMETDGNVHGGPTSQSPLAAA